MDKPKNRIKEVLEEKGNQADMVSRQTRKEFLHCQFLCLQQTSAKFGCVIRNCEHPTS